MTAPPLHLVCPHCDGVNRILSTRLADEPSCGKCHNRLFTGTPLELNAQRFDKQIKRNDLPVVVDFWAPWCGPCKAMAPAFAEAARQLEPSFRLAKLNTEAEPAVAARYQIRSIPTLILFLRGNEIARHSGALGVADIAHWVQQAHSAVSPTV